MQKALFFIESYMKLLNKFISCIISAELSLLSLGGFKSASADVSFGVPLTLEAGDMIDGFLDYARLLIFWPFALIGIVGYLVSYIQTRRNKSGETMKFLGEKFLIAASFFGVLFFLIFPYLASYASSIEDDLLMTNIEWALVVAIYFGFGLYLLLLVFIVRNKLSGRHLLSGKKIIKYENKKS